MSKRFRNRAWARAHDECRPQSGQTVSGGVYVSLIIPASVRDVRLDGVVILADATVAGTNITGTILIPRGNISQHQFVQQPEGPAADMAPNLHPHWRLVPYSRSSA